MNRSPARARIEPHNRRRKLAAQPAEQRLVDGRTVVLLDLSAPRRQQDVVGEDLDAAEQVGREDFDGDRLKERDVVSSGCRVEGGTGGSFGAVEREVPCGLAVRAPVERDLRRGRVSPDVRVGLRSEGQLGTSAQVLTDTTDMRLRPRQRCARQVPQDQLAVLADRRDPQRPVLAPPCVPRNACHPGSVALAVSNDVLF